MVQHILPFGDVTDRSITLPIRVTPNPRDAASFESINCDDALIQTTVPLCFSVINETSSARADGSGTAIDTVPLLGEPPQMTPSVLVRVAVLGAIGSISLIANVMALASIFRMRQRRISSHNSSLYTLLAHMAVADLLVTLFCIVAEACWTYTIEWMADVYTCKTLKYAQLFSLYLSTFILIVLALDQLLIVRYPLRKDTNIVTIRRAIISAWIVAALLSVPQLIIFRVEIGPFNVPFYQCVTHGFYTEPWQEQVYVTTSLLLMFVLPLATLVITYGTTFRTIANLPALHCGEFDSNLCRSGSQQRTSLSTAVAKLESIRPMRCGTTANSHPMEVTRRRLLARAKKKSLMITVVIVVAFIVCWTPYYAMMVIFIFNLDPGQKITGELQSAIFFFGSSTAMINPAIYGAFHLRRPRTTKLRNSTVVLSAAAFRKPSSNSPSVATTTLGRRRNQKKSHHTRVRHYLISKSPSNTLPVYASQQHEPGELPKMEVEVRLEAS